MNEKGRKGKESKQRLLEAAAHEFAIQGFHAAKVSTIVQKAGLTQPSFYLYFQSKEAVFEELVAEFHSGLRKLAESSRLEAGMEPSHVSLRVTRSMETVFRYLADDPDLTRIGFFLSPEAGGIKRELTRTMKLNLQEEQRLGYFRPELDMDFAADCLLGVIEHMTREYLLPSAKDPAELAALVVQLFMRGMLPGESAERIEPEKER